MINIFISQRIEGRYKMFWKASCEKNRSNRGTTLASSLYLSDHANWCIVTVRLECLLGNDHWRRHLCYTKLINHDFAKHVFQYLFVWQNLFWYNVDSEQLVIYQSSNLSFSSEKFPLSIHVGLQDKPSAQPLLLFSCVG